MNIQHSFSEQKYWLIVSFNFEIVSFVYFDSRATNMLPKGVIAISFVMIFWQSRDTLVEGDRKCKGNVGNLF